jgi:hypothetical protein
MSSSTVGDDIVVCVNVPHTQFEQKMYGYKTLSYTFDLPDVKKNKKLKFKLPDKNDDVLFISVNGQESYAIQCLEESVNLGETTWCLWKIASSTSNERLLEFSNLGTAAILSVNPIKVGVDTTGYSLNLTVTGSIAFMIVAVDPRESLAIALDLRHVGSGTTTIRSVNVDDENDVRVPEESGNRARQRSLLDRF